ncbi:MAG: LPP20 family lipoprotein [Thiotrichaceae bacterium]|nr:LPP20 family lipoprotein [Thiotrichaceae bacterium]
MIKNQHVKKFFVGLITVLGTMMLIGCTGAQKAEVPPPMTCTYPDDPTAQAPDWICNPLSVEGAELSALGTSKKSNGFVAKHICMATARMELAQRLRTTVDGMLKQYAESTDNDDKEMMLQISQRMGSKVTLPATRLIKNATSPKGKLYCLVTMDSKQVITSITKAAEKEAKTIQSKALWQKFKEKISIDDMIQQLQEVK